MFQEDQKGCKKSSIRTEDEQVAASRTQQHEDKEDTGIRPLKTKDKKKVGRRSEECDACKIRKAARKTTHVLKRNKQLLHRRNNTKTRRKIPA